MLFGRKVKAYTILVKDITDSYIRGRIAGLVEALAGAENFKDTKLVDTSGNHVMTALTAETTKKIYAKICEAIEMNYPGTCLFDNE